MTVRETPSSAPPVLGGKQAWWGNWQIWMILLGLAAAPILWWQEPNGQIIYPRCWLYSHTGWQCPGCGGLRCAHALLHGRWGEAWRYNPLAMVSAPLGIWWAAVETLGLVQGRRYYHPFRSGGFWILLGLAASIFGVARNLNHF